MLRYDSARINSAVFNEINNNTASKVVTSSEANNIVEWDLYPTSGGDPVVLTSVQTNQNTRITSAIYIDKEKIVALDSRNKQLLYINSGNNSIVKTIPINASNNFIPKTLHCDFRQRFILIQPDSEYGNELIFVDTAGNYIVNYIDNVPITSVFLSENENKLYIALLDNTIKAISLDNFPDLTATPPEQFDFAKDYNLINTISVSNDGNMIAAATRKVAATRDIE
jgi:hypothetical protein